ncbi:PucR family transcriptional regulator [Actinomycetospora cinnamomea]|uniref:PucR-like helix-turn-helix protein n=1 Tax=Actinomycetospora cinnamomea TaxID=663609 RepID=A0A2U1F6V1_9PSEU|nr:helix-turn-helix domain-containing protein [Actinomycetospora cinnamomea]PVZ07913.1 PucR-like helix-turn-helix protein [Actinomycetospora cinnamomea]
MHNPAESSAERARRWRELVERVRDDADALRAAFLRRVRAVPSYARGLVPDERLEVDADDTFAYLLGRLAGRTVPERLCELGPAIGRDRARRGVPLDDLLTAVRQDFQVLWEALRARAALDEAALLVDRVQTVWAVVEEYSTRIRRGYQEEEAVLARERQGERTALVAALLAVDDPAPEDVARAAIALELDADDDVLVAAAAGGDAVALRRAADRLAADGRPVHVQPAGRHSVLLARWEGPEGAPVRAALEGVRCGVGPTAHGLGEVPRSARLAGELAEVTAGGPVEPRTLASAWLPLAAARLGDVGADLVAAELGGLDGVTPAERERLVATVLRYVATGSVADTAASSFCHRNTVLNRLRRVTALTGRDVTVPADAAVLVLALTCRDRPARGPRECQRWAIADVECP